MKLFAVNEKGELAQLNKLDFIDEEVYLVDNTKRNTIFIWVGLNVSQNKKDKTARIARKLDKERGGSCKILIMKQTREYGSFMAIMDDLHNGLIPGETTEERPELVLFEPLSEEKEKIPEMDTRIHDWLKQLIFYRQQIVDTPEAQTIDLTEEKDVSQDLSRLEWLKQYVASKNITVEEVVDALKKEGKKPPFLNISDDTDFESQVQETAYFISLSKNTYDELCWYLAEKVQTINLGTPSEKEIRSKAEEIFKSSSTYDELCWLNAEMDLLIRGRFFDL